MPWRQDSKIINLASDCYELIESIFTDLYLLQHSDDPTFNFLTATYQTLNLELKVCVTTPTEAANLLGFCLLHYGVLQPFTSGRQSGKKNSVSSSQYVPMKKPFAVTRFITT